MLARIDVDESNGVESNSMMGSIKYIPSKETWEIKAKFVNARKETREDSSTSERPSLDGQMRPPPSAFLIFAAEKPKNAKNFMPEESKWSAIELRKVLEKIWKDMDEEAQEVSSS